jgi:hypothetical protein
MLKSLCDFKPCQTITITRKQSYIIQCCCFVPSLNEANNLQVKLNCCQPRLWQPNFISRIKMKTFFWTFVPHDQEWIWYLIRPFILWKKGIIVCWIKKMTRCHNATNYFISLYSFKTKESTLYHTWLSWCLLNMGDNMFDDKCLIPTNVGKVATINTHFKCQARQGITHLKF